jgi:hypothetical protein
VFLKRGTEQCREENVTGRCAASDIVRSLRGFRFQLGILYKAPVGAQKVGCNAQNLVKNYKAPDVPKECIKVTVINASILNVNHKCNIDNGNICCFCF